MVMKSFSVYLVGVGYAYIQRKGKIQTKIPQLPISTNDLYKCLINVINNKSTSCSKLVSPLPPKASNLMVNKNKQANKKSGT